METLLGTIDTDTGAIVTALQLLDNAVYVDDADWTGDTSSHLLVGGLYQSVPQTVTDGDVAPFNITVNGALHVVQQGNITADLGATDNAVLDAIAASVAAADTDLTTIIGHVDGIEGILTTMDADTGSILTAVQIMDDWDETDRAKVNPIVGQAGVQGGSGAVSANTQRVVLATDVGLPASTNNIGDVDVLSAVSATLDHGSNRDIDALAEQITSTSFACKFGLLLRGSPDNSGIIYIGNSDVTAGTTDATDGMPLQAGESMWFPCSNSNIPYAIGSTTNQIVYWLAV